MPCCHASPPQEADLGANHRSLAKGLVSLALAMGQSGGQSLGEESFGVEKPWVYRCLKHFKALQRIFVEYGKTCATMYWCPEWIWMVDFSCINLLAKPWETQLHFRSQSLGSLGSLGSPPAEATLRSKNCSASERWKSRSSSLVVDAQICAVCMLLDIGPRLVVWNMTGLWLSHHVGDVIIPTDFHIFQRGRSTTNQWCFVKMVPGDHGKKFQVPIAKA